MISFKDYLKEASLPIDTSLNFYHGTKSREAALGIAANGIQPPVNIRRGLLAPVAGKVYITPDIGYAQIYAIGGDIAGSSVRLRSQFGSYGYLFVVPGTHLNDIQPDEDSVGLFVYEKKFPWLDRMAKDFLTPSTLRRLMDGYTAYQASGGKQLLRRMNAWHKAEIIAAGAHIAHAGVLHPTELWRIPLSSIIDLKKDGSNFFDIAEKINPKDI